MLFLGFCNYNYNTTYPKKQRIDKLLLSVYIIYIDLLALEDIWKVLEK